MQVHFLLQNLPKSINRSYAVSIGTGGGRFYKRRDSHEAQELMSQELWVQMKGRDRLESDLKAVIAFYWPTKRRRDIDNGLKMTLDAMSQVVYDDDIQVKELHVYSAVDKDKPRVEIEITKLEKVEKSSESDKKTEKVRAIIKGIRTQS